MNFRRKKSINKVKYKTVIKKAVNSYVEIMEKFDELGISKSEELTGALGEYYCKELFGIDLVNDSVNTGFDGFYKNKKIEIKTRTFNSMYFSIRKNKLKLFDWAFFVILNPDYNLADIFAVSRSVISKKINKHGTFTLSGKLINANPKRIKHIYHDRKYSTYKSK